MSSERPSALTPTPLMSLLDQHRKYRLSANLDFVGALLSLSMSVKYPVVQFLPYSPLCLPLPLCMMLGFMTTLMPNIHDHFWVIIGKC